MATEITLWQLQGFADVASCVLRETANGFALALKLGDDQIHAERHPLIEQTVSRADELRARLVRRGWRTPGPHPPALDRSA